MQNPSKNPSRTGPRAVRLDFRDRLPNAAAFLVDTGLKMSLKLRIDILIGALLFFGLAADIGRMIVAAGARVRIESESMTRITRDFIGASLANLPDDATAQARLGQLAAQLNELRHVRVTFSADSRAAAATQTAPDERRLLAPTWFYALVGAQPGVTLLPALRDGRRLGDFIIAGDPADEVNEVWQDVKTLSLTGGLIVLAALFGASAIVARTLAPLAFYTRALGQLKDGEYSVRAEARGSPEFVDLCAKLNALAEALARLSRDNRALFCRLMTAQEQERKVIAHELHDEMGPHLFALRAKAAVSRAELERAGLPDAAKRAAALSGQIEALQETNRRILRRLRPPALDDLGLAPALRSLVDGWRQTQPALRLDLRMPEDFEIADADRRLAVYRLVQEALTNVFRHSGAGRAEIALERDAAGDVRVRVEDDGAGLAPDSAAGLGLAGMRERVRGLGGRVEIGRGALGGCRVDAVVPDGGPHPPGARGDGPTA
jgi:two-component system sensor histidine kinase UhpB